jgi:hypothetical protein
LLPLPWSGSPSADAIRWLKSDVTRRFFQSFTAEHFSARCPAEKNLKRTFLKPLKNQRFLGLFGVVNNWCKTPKTLS